MAIREPSFSVGIEEEYLLVNQETRDLEPKPPEALLAKCEEALRGQVSPEFRIPGGLEPGGYTVTATGEVAQAPAACGPKSKRTVLRFR